MFKITEHPKSIKEIRSTVSSGFQIQFENGNTISVQFGLDNYCENREESKPTCKNAEIAIWDIRNKWYDFGDNTVKGWCSADEVAKWIHFASTTKI